VPSVAAVKKKIEKMLMTILGSVEKVEDGSFIVRQGSAVCIVSVVEGFGDDRTVVVVSSPMLEGVPVTEALCRWIATEGQNFLLGSVSLDLDEDDDGKTGMVSFNYSMVGDDLDESELEAAVLVVVGESDVHDNKLQKMFGGTLFTSGD